jgi:predicted component of type VI protein secretion system
MQANDSYRLIVRRGPQPNQVYQLTGEVSNVGRDITNNIVINDREVSRHHLRLMRGAEGYTVEDLGSTNGTFINGKRVTGATPLKNGDMLGLGETVTLLFEAGRPGSVSAAPQPAAEQPAPRQPEERYRPPEPAEDNPYAPPQEAYQPPQQGYPQPQQDAYAPAQQPYQQPEPYQQQQAAEPAYGEQQSQYEYAPASYGPPPPGYDYDPYAMREEEGGGVTQWLVIGCFGLLLVCCCATVIAAVAVDSLCLYDAIPGLVQVLDAVGVQVQCLP